MEPDEFFVGHPLALAVPHTVHNAVRALSRVEVHAKKSQVAFRRKRGFAYLWLPGKYLSRPSAEVVLSIALGRHDASPRFKEGAHPTSKHWIHHLEVHDVGDIDAAVVAWLREAADRVR
jgi:hypothetical protein